MPVRNREGHGFSRAAYKRRVWRLQPLRYASGTHSTGKTAAIFNGLPNGHNGMRKPGRDRETLGLFCSDGKAQGAPLP
jgi:hypothetical protein